MTNAAESMSTVVPDLTPPLTFRDMSEVLKRAAVNEAMGLDALNLFALRDPSGVGLATIADVQRHCAALVEMSELFRVLAPYEDHVRQVAARAAERR